MSIFVAIKFQPCLISYPSHMLFVHYHRIIVKR